MNHLENVRLKNSYQRSERLIRGLGTFIRDETTYRQSLSGSIISQSTRTTSVARSSNSNDHRRRSNRERIETSSVSSDSTSVVSSGETLSKSDRNPSLSLHSLPTSLSDLPSIQEASGNGSIVGGTGEQIELRMAFERSAKLIRESMGMDGLIFLDASPVSFSNNPLQEHQVDGMPVAVPDPFTSISGTLPGISASKTVSQLLAADFVRDRPRPAMQIPDSLIYRLIRQYTQGTILSADEDGPFEKRFTPIDSNPSKPPTPVRRGSRDQNDAAELFGHLPGACSIIFLPLWHFQKERWFAAAIGWTDDATKSFDPSDATFLSAFGNSIMAEVLRLETLAVSNAKSDFISSISHELRSPLHGILATTELLSDAIKSSEEQALLNMVRSCGTTLLDTMNHLLEYAKINSLARSRKGKAPAGDSRLMQLLQGSGGIDLGELIEEVVESVVIGFAFEKAVHADTIHENVASSMARLGVSELEPEIPVLVSVQIQPNQNWSMVLDTGGWKRIVLNLFGNALKYTPNGSINVSLAVSKQLVGDHIRFTIEDTGIGMSREYQRTQMFRPFMQENSLSTGAGLGLYLVQQIVFSMGGTVKVQSQIGVGTRVTVSMPFPAVPHVSTPGAMPKPLVGHIHRLRGLTLGFIEPEPLLEDTDEPYGLQKSVLKYKQSLKASITEMAKDWLRMKTISGTPTSITADIFAIDDSLGPIYVSPKELLPSTYDPLLVICAPRSNKSNSLTAGTVLRLPFGPRRLAATLVQALEQAEERRKQGAASITGSDSFSAYLPHTLPPARLPSPPEEYPFTTMPSPLPVEPAAAMDTMPSTPTPARTPGGQFRQHVLVVDDNAINLKILVTLIKRLGCSYMTASNGFEAVEHYKGSSESAESFNWVFMDISMPVMDGFQATREIRAHEAEIGMTAATIVALTGLGSAASEKEAFESGMNLFLRKPVSLSKLKMMLTNDVGR
jgi:signal transduction histidine kinase/ActR/RegA family two-component response regulator